MKIKLFLRSAGTLLLAVFFSLYPWQAAALPKITVPDFFLSLSAGTALGEAREFVYSSDVIVSDLVWPMLPVFLLDAEVSAEWKGGLWIETGFSAGIPAKTGTMTDSDFLNQPASDEKTHLSVHDGYLEHAFEWTISAGWEFLLRFTVPKAQKPVSIKPGIGFTIMSYKWSAVDGYTQYENAPGSKNTGDYDAWKSDTAKTNVYGTGITYQQLHWIPRIGVSASFPLPLNFTVCAGFSGFPFTWCNGLDNHWKNGADYYDIMESGFLVEPELAIYWDYSDRGSVFFEGKWRYIGNLRGDTYIVNTSTGLSSLYKAEDGEGSGARFSAVYLRAGVRIRLN
ncbi:omptin family outer membrane protease [Brucepastera parasyntrophica]|uniref:omptin family outer membrane protease n=1 Tax=Brucepastera parasyntrophica TaxID=2880008 RepID=UPI00210A3D21|nr:omptin family outer membrane protease [Brucepastera parasyntrophica]ULQ59061.1 omptin family outer membrane protease [Brucepastera parasyntrophica]